MRAAGRFPVARELTTKIVVEFEDLLPRFAVMRPAA